MEEISGSLYIRPLGGRYKGIAVGETVAGHTHNFDHTTFFANGRWQVNRTQQVFDEDGNPTKLWVRVGVENEIFEAPCYLLIPANVKHEITYLGPEPIGVAWCVYSHRTSQGEVSVHPTGDPSAYV